MARFPTVRDNEWLTVPVDRGYRVKCCSCGAIHDVQVDIVPHGKAQAVRLKPIFRKPTKRRKR